MRSSRAWILALLVGVIAVAIFFMITNSGGNKDGDEIAQDEQVQLANVVVVLQDIPARTEITAEMIQVQQIPAEYVHPMAIITAEDAVGMISLIPMNAGEQLLKTKIADPNTNYLSYQLREGYVAFTVAVSELTSAGGMIRVGDRVNVLGNFASDVAGDDITTFFMYDVPVIAIGQNMSIGHTEEDASNFANMTLEVMPEDAQKLAWAQNHGAISFILTSVMDKDDYKEIDAINAKSFFGDTEEFKSKEYLEMLKKFTELRQAEEELLEYGQGDVQHIREKLKYEGFYYDNLNKSSKTDSSKTDSNKK